MLLVLRDSSNNLCAAILDGGSVQTEFKPTAIQESAALVARRITPALEAKLASKLKTSVKNSAKPGDLTLVFHVQVRSDAVLHRMSIQLREQLDKVVADWNSRQPPGTATVRLMWSDSN